jgi:hypothetical protein
VTALVAAVARITADVQKRTALGSSARQTAMRFNLRASCVDFATRIYSVVHRTAANRPDTLVHSDAA